MRTGEIKVWSEAKQCMITVFENKWGISAIQLAKLEGVTADAIHMRVHKWGTPYQRRAKTTMWEDKYGKTLGEMAIEQGLHPITLANKYYKFGDVYAVTDQRFAKGKHTRVDWTQNPKYKKMIKPTYFKLEDVL